MPKFESRRFLDKITAQLLPPHAFVIVVFS